MYVCLDLFLYIGSLAIKCYQCRQQGTMCKKSSTSAPIYSQCLTLVGTKFGESYIAAYCATLQQCSNITNFCARYEAYGYNNCQGACCSTDNCNGSNKQEIVQAFLPLLLFGVLTANMLK